MASIIAFALFFLVGFICGRIDRKQERKEMLEKEK